MKNFLLSLILLIGFSGIAASQTITVHMSGTVNRDSTGVPVANHQVIIQADSNAYGFHFYATRMTNPNGFYDCTIHEVPATGAAITFVVRTKNCDSTTLTQTFAGTTTPATINFIICNGNPGVCEAAFQSHADSVQPGLIHFHDTSYPQGQILSRIWDFGDGSPVVSNVPDPDHVYPGPGTFNCCLTIETSTGCTSHRCHPVTVENNTACHASYHFYADSTNLLRLHFYDTSTPANMIASRLWIFEAGQTATTYDPWYTFSAPGVYNVCLVITTTDSCTSEKCDEITVHGSSYDVYGRIEVGSTVIDHGLVDLIKVDAGAMTVVDSREINDSLGSYWFGGVLPGHYYIKASLLPSSAFYGQYLPTYYIHSVNWTGANLIELGQPANPYNFAMVPALQYNAGSGAISGVISQNAKINSSGTPAPNVEILLLNSSNEPLSYTTSDQDGRFSFAGMAYAEYSVYPEIAGKNTTATRVTLSNGTPAVSTSFTIQGNNVLGIHDQAKGFVTEISEVFPNPSAEKAYITVNSAKEKAISVAVYFITGQAAGEFRFTLESGTNQLMIPVKDLSNGLYYLSIKDDQGTSVIRKMVIRK